MNINELTLGQIKEIKSMFGTSCNVPTPNHSWIVGKCYFIRTVTYHYTGRLVSVTDTDLVLEDAAWIADSGRFATALESGALNEVEPYPGTVLVSRAGVIDASEWKHDLPRGQK